MAVSFAGRDQLGPPSIAAHPPEERLFLRKWYEDEGRGVPASGERTPGRHEREQVGVDGVGLAA
jgi:hypothetical protein